ncbi:uncharacterized protein LOC132861639 [Tachysurus vachellii]|uniref:uncharacterized protein LOC132861639 n=1 Tax=Tachysurus vachellii TaxID=175792 RepID=UPI00296ACA93|nr:uncharacterized protein LOC132861639 [Tachysurus vachellii]
MFASAPLLLLALAPYVFCATELIQPDSLLIKPGETLTITCKVSGASITDSSSHYGTAWIRQPAGKALEWINTIYHSGGIHKKDSLKDKFVVSRDTASNSMTLRGQNMQTEATAVYYCTRDPHSDTTSCNVFCATELIQPDSLLIKPGETLTITCKVSGASITDSSHYGTAWIRQPAGKALEWINSIYYDGSIHKKDSLKDKFVVSRDTSSNSVTLRGQNMQTEDTAVSFCH